MLSYTAPLPLSSDTLTRVSVLIRSHRKQIGSRWRALDPGQQALLTLAHLHKSERLADLAASFGISASTSSRRIRETIGLLSAEAPGSTHDTKAARIWQIPRLLREYGLFALGDKGYDGLDHDLVVTPYKGRGKPEWQREANRVHARLRGPGERMFSQLKKWSIFDRIRCDPQRVTQIAKAVQVLNGYEHRS
ncbi:transposase family protein [Glycomyces rhizosphaerae]|uniref:Transposase family protein n=1 Tax=Glycomyces rhizosphaerae TaxID=2054422 RepID=A0ABV7Q323_9ACTN